jgi:hypothetical protein
MPQAPGTGALEEGGHLATMDTSLATLAGSGGTGGVVITGPTATDPFRASVFAAGYLRVANEPTQLFQDGFDTATLDITNKWKAPTAAGGGVAANNQLTQTVLGTGTTISGYSYLESAVTFPPVNPGWLYWYTGVALPNPILVNQYFFFGLGTNPATPTAALPLTNACGFEITTAGKLMAVTYQSGARVLIADLSSSGTNKQPLDANIHKYFIYYRGDQIIFCLDSQDNVVASTTTGAPGPDVNILPIKFMAIAGPVAPVSSGLLTVAMVTLADTAKNSFQLSDGTYPWRQVTVDANGNLAIGIGSAVAAVGDGVTTGVIGAQQMLFNGGSSDRLRTPTRFVTIANVAVTAGVPAAIWTPGAGKKFHMMGFAVSLSVAGFVIFKDATTEFIRTPAMAAGSGIVNPANLGNGYSSTVANNVLNLDVSATGNINGFLFGTDEF